MSTHKILTSLVFLIGIFISSCVPPPAVVELNNSTIINEYSNQEKAELSVKSYLKRTFDSLGTYEPYGFGVVKEIIPDQVSQLEELKYMKKLLPGMKDHYGNKLDSVKISYDTLIAQKEREIITKKVRSFWKISHLYLVSLKTDSIIAYEVEFTLDPNFKVYDAKSSLYLNLDKNKAKWFDFYYMQYPLFDTWDDEGDQKRSQEIYDFYDQKMMSLSNDKGEILDRILFIIQHIKTTGEFSNQKVTEAIIKNEMRQLYGASYQTGKFSTLKAIIKNSEDGNQKLIGYSIVHIFKTGAENLLVEKGLYFELDPWLILAGNLPIEPPYDSYFEN
jgi:hypothetical protein